MKISDAGIALIKEFEGVRLEAYPDPATGADPWTIGVGHTGPDVHRGLVIDEARVDELLRADLDKFERCVSVAVNDIPQNQFDACVALAFNIGCRAFSSSTLARKLASGDASGAADEFLKWDMAAGHHMAGLTRRRRAERALFLGER
jgi:lysozyme